MDAEARERYLKIVLKVIGIAFIGLIAVTTLFPDSWMWEPRQQEYEQMILVVYATLGVFLLRASGNPSEHRSLIAFTAWSSLAHGALMALQAVRDPAEQANLWGDVPAIIIIGIVLLWLSPRRG